MDFKSKLTKTFVGSSAGLADTSENTTTRHTRASDLIFKDVDEVALVFFAYKNALVALRRLSAFSGYDALETDLRETAFVVGCNYVLFKNRSQFIANEN